MVLFGDFGQVRLRCLDHAFDIAAGGVIDERVMTIPPSVAGVKDLSLNKIGRYVAVSVAGPVVGERDSGTIKVQGFFLIEDLVGNRACGRRREGEVPAFHARGRGKVFSGVLMREDRRALRMHPFVAVGVIEMPVCVDEVVDRARIYLSQSVSDPGARSCITGIDNHFAVSSSEDGDVSAGADKSTHIFAQGLDGDVSGFRTFARRNDNVFTFGKEMSWRQPRRRGQDSGGGDETPARKVMRIVSNRVILVRHVCSFVTV